MGVISINNEKQRIITLNIVETLYLVELDMLEIPNLQLNYAELLKYLWSKVNTAKYKIYHKLRNSDVIVNRITSDSIFLKDATKHPLDGYWVWETGIQTLSNHGGLITKRKPDRCIIHIPSNNMDIINAVECLYDVVQDNIPIVLAQYINN
eukprot:UN26121